MDRSQVIALFREELQRSALASIVRQLQGLFVAGYVDSLTPDIIAGTGFTVSKIGVGDIAVNFDKPFPRPPVVLLGNGGSGGAIYRVKLHATDPFPTELSFRVAIVNDAAALVDRSFTFLAIKV